MAGNVNTIDKTTDDQKGGGTSYLGKLDNNKNFDIGKLTQKKSEIDVTEDTKNEIETLGYLPSYGVSVGYDKKSNPNYDKWDAKNSFPDKFTEDSSKKSISINTKSIGNKNENYTMPSDPESSFKFDTIHDFEDPTFLTFDIFLYTDRSSALFDTQTPYGVYAFLKKNEKISKDFEQRIQILNEFKNRIENIFYTSDEFDYLNQNKKTHYIQSIEGIDKFKKPIINYKEDKIKITLVEDVKMTAEYIAELYNNLSYDYKFKRKSIPENCLRFDMGVMISDIRRFKKTKPKSSNSNQIIEEENKNISREIFILRDCNFNFKNSFNVSTTLTQGGFNTSNPDTSNLKFDIYYKSAERALFADLFDQGNQGKNMRLITHNNSNEEANLIYDKGKNNFYINEHLKNGVRNYKNNKGLANMDRETPTENENNNLSDKLKKSFTDISKKHINQFKNQALSIVRQKKGKLLESFRQQLTDELQIESISPDNVYDPSFNEISLENFVKGLRGDLYNTITSEISGELSRRGDDIINQI
jgi:hypothetical protein